MTTWSTPHFIVGCERSGTTLLATALGRHSAILVPPETHFCGLMDAASDVPRRTHADFLKCLIDQPLLKEFPVTPSELAECFARREASFPFLFAALLQATAEKFGGAQVVEKTPSHLEHLDRLFTWFPAAKAIALVRDGRDVARSLQRVPWGSESLFVNFRRWQQQSKRLSDAVDRYPERILVVRFEDYVAAPREQMAKVVCFLDLSPEAEQFDTNRPVTTAASWELGWKREALGDVDPLKARAWTSALSAAEALALSLLGRNQLRRWRYDGVPLPWSWRAGARALSILSLLALERLYNSVFPRSSLVRLTISRLLTALSGTTALVGRQA